MQIIELLWLERTEIHHFITKENYTNVQVCIKNTDLHV